MDRLLLALEHDGDVVAAGDDADESRQARDRRLVHRHERGAGHRRLDVARVHHAGQRHVDGPLQRAVHLRRDVVARRRLADVAQRRHRLDARLAGGGVDVAAVERHVEAPAADQLAVGDARAASPAPRRRPRARPGRPPARRAAARPSRAGRGAPRRRRGASASRRPGSRPSRPSRPDRRSRRCCPSRRWSARTRGRARRPCSCRNAVPVPCPRSVLPTKSVAVLSARITIQESSWRKSGSG